MDTTAFMDTMASSTMAAMTTTSPEMEEVLTTAEPDAPMFIMKQISGDIPEFQMILPCIFGIFIILSLSLMVFYTKNPEEDDVRHKFTDIDNNEKSDKKENWF